MAPTEGRVARPERWWGCRRSSPIPFKEAPSMPLIITLALQQYTALNERKFATEPMYK